MPDSLIKRAEGWVGQHKKTLIGAGAAGAAGLGYLSYRKNQAAAANPLAAPDMSTVSSTASGAAGSGSAAITGYTGTPWDDTTGTDVYNALQPSLAQNTGLLSQLIALMQQGTTTTTTTPPKKTTPKKGPPATTGPVKANPKPVKKTPAPTKKKPAKTTYTVRKGDNLTAIGARYGISWHTIYNANKNLINRLNGGKGANLIYAGTKLVIPK